MIIYKITNIKNNKAYIGKTIKTLEQRFKLHVCASFIFNKKLQKFYSNTVLSKAIRKYGHNGFITEILEVCNVEDNLNIQEKYWISFFKTQTFNYGYNLTAGGDGGKTYIITKEQRIKAQNNIKNRPKEIQDKFIYANLGRDFSQTHRDKLRIVSTRTNKTTETCKYCNATCNWRNIRKWHNEFTCKLSPKFDSSTRTRTQAQKDHQSQVILANHQHKLHKNAKTDCI